MDRVGIEEELSKKIEQVKEETKKLADSKWDEPFEEYEAWSKLHIHVKRDIEMLKIRIKHAELMLQKEYEAKGVKAIKTREQLARDDFTNVKLLLEEYKLCRDELYLQCELLRYVLGAGDDG